MGHSDRTLREMEMGRLVIARNKRELYITNLMLGRKVRTENIRRGNDILVEVTAKLNDKFTFKHTEPYSEFPSETLVAKLMLIFD